jgi:MoaA/NifB/PqqE/SkfB family radical SAM enzyme
MLRYAKSKGTVIEIMDHFAHFKDEAQIKELLEIGPDFQFVSTYGATKETSDNICVGSDFNIILKNIKIFIKLKKQMKKKFPILNFHYIVTRKSKDELLKFLDFLHSLKTEIGEVLVTPMLHDFKEAKNYAVKIEKSYIEKVEKKATRYKIPITINLAAQKEAMGLIKKPPINFCKEYIMPFIFVTGHVTPCCGQNEANQRKWQKKMSLGNVFEKDFKKIWYSQRYKKLRELIRKNKCPKECAFCPSYDLDRYK